MFIYNLKVNGKLWFKIIIIIMSLIVLGVFAFSIYRLFFADDGIIKHSDVTEILPSNYTNILKAVHDDLESYLGKEIKFSGYVYRIIDFSDKQFVLARDMVVDSQSYVVGFLCEYDKIRNFADKTWVEITGTITEGKYHNQTIPIIKITHLNKIEKTQEEFVFPPSNTYVPTSALL